MFDWPTTTEHGDTVTISARHWTVWSDNVVRSILPFVLVALMAGFGFWCYARTGNAVLSIMAGVYSIYPAFFMALILVPAIWLVVLQRTVVVIAPGYVRAGGTKYDRGRIPIQFTNLYPHKMSVEQGGGGRTMHGSLEETTGLRMFYGTNALLITRFRSSERASRFALACNAALERVTTNDGYRLPSVNVGELYEGREAVADRPAIAAAAGGRALPPGQQQQALPSRSQEKGMRAIIISRTTYTGGADRPSRPPVGALIFALLVYAGVGAAVYFHAQVGQFIGETYKVLLGRTEGAGSSPAVGYGVVAVAAALGLAVCGLLIRAAVLITRRFIDATPKVVLWGVALLAAAGLVGGRYYNEQRRAREVKDISDRASQHPPVGVVDPTTRASGGPSVKPVTPPAPARPMVLYPAVPPSAPRVIRPGDH